MHTVYMQSVTRVRLYLFLLPTFFFVVMHPIIQNHNFDDLSFYASSSLGNYPPENIQIHEEYFSSNSPSGGGWCAGSASSAEWWKVSFSATHTIFAIQVMVWLQKSHL